jgi:predicted metalloprotease with PDZ domain
LGDTAVAAQMLYSTPSDGRARRRGTDFYEESIFLWLDVDTLLRERSQGRVTLDDFCRRFYGGANSGPSVIPYSRDDVVKALNELVPFDWQGLMAERIDRVAPRLPMSGVERAGWRLVYNDKPNLAIEDDESRRENHDWRFSLGFAVVMFHSAPSPESLSSSSPVFGSAQTSRICLPPFSAFMSL